MSSISLPFVWTSILTFDGDPLQSGDAFEVTSLMLSSSVSIKCCMQESFVFAQITPGCKEVPSHLGSNTVSAMYFSALFIAEIFCSTEGALFLYH